MKLDGIMMFRIDDLALRGRYFFSLYIFLFLLHSHVAGGLWYQKSEKKVWWCFVLRFTFRQIKSLHVLRKKHLLMQTCPVHNFQLTRPLLRIYGRGRSDFFFFLFLGKSSHARKLEEYGNWQDCIGFGGGGGREGALSDGKFEREHLNRTYEKLNALTGKANVSLCHLDTAVAMYSCPTMCV
ncbi:hypothetical protein B0T24DRAFT_91527 [Lasiosphaeria ovina]|uniref:Uncharacterized protein n=1 Tax=Lasiosphaeria ovina TaxID=92902 RepID=A0AAE0TYR7_9PEZI|nr:hypothetical protein B0T24DRAFT_91527 [Lasiosphaeria ovina]